MYVVHVQNVFPCKVTLNQIVLDTQEVKQFSCCSYKHQMIYIGRRLFYIAMENPASDLFFILNIGLCVCIVVKYLLSIRENHQQRIFNTICKIYLGKYSYSRFKIFESFKFLKRFSFIFFKEAIAAILILP